MTDRTKTAYDNWAPSYDSDPNPHTALEYRPMLETLAARRGEKVLDAACGTGRYAAPLHAEGVDVTGLDFSPAMLAVAQRRVPAIRLIEADLNDPLPLDAGSFDAVICAQALKHVEDLSRRASRRRPFRIFGHASGHELGRL